MSRGMMESQFSHSLMYDHHLNCALLFPHLTTFSHPFTPFTSFFLCGCCFQFLPSFFRFSLPSLFITFITFLHLSQTFCSFHQLFEVCRKELFQPSTTCQTSVDLLSLSISASNHYSFCTVHAYASKLNLEVEQQLCCPFISPISYYLISPG